MIDYFPAAINFALDPSRDGQGAHCTPGDSGGWTNNGIIWPVFCAWATQHSTTPNNLNVFKSQTRAQLEPIYRAWFWGACRCGEMGPIGVAVFDIACGSGPGTAAKLLQDALGVAADGHIGPVTMAALAAADPVALNVDLLAARLAFYARLPNANLFLNGWTNRAEACRDLVASILKPKE